MASRRCPVCRASFRGTRPCTRCGADLTPLMLLYTAAYCLRREAMAALVSGELEEAAELVRRAQAQCSSLQGQRLCELIRWIQSTEQTDIRSLSDFVSLIP